MRSRLVQQDYGSSSAANPHAAASHLLFLAATLAVAIREQRPKLLLYLQPKESIPDLFLGPVASNTQLAKPKL